MNKFVLNPPSNIGIIGGGQLGRMISFYAKRLGYCVTILDPTPSSPAMQVADDSIVASFTDKAALKSLSNVCDVITYEFEHIDADLLIELEKEGHRIIPSGKTLKIIQDKYEQKLLLKNAGLPVPEFYKVENKLDILECIEKLGLPIVLKSSKGGYDGKGNFIIKSRDEIDIALEKLHSDGLIVEKFINFNKELSIIIARDQNNNFEFYPIVENIHEDNILRLTKAPAAIENHIENKIMKISEKVIETLGDIGIFCIEFFLTDKGEVYINEIAPRPHNSGHYTIEACITSQFEQLVRIITGLPLGSAELISPSVMVNILGNDTVKGNYTVDGVESILREEKTYLHLYGKKTTDTLKKLGHITVCNDCIKKAEQMAVKALNTLEIKGGNY